MRWRLCIILSLLVLTSCLDTDKELVVPGVYSMDKFVCKKGMMPKGNKNSELTLFPNHTFGLTYIEGIETITGTWEVLDISTVQNNFREPEKEAQVLFHTGNKHITGILRGTIFRFESPNDFQPDIYKHRIFVKSVK